MKLNPLFAASKWLAYQIAATVTPFIYRDKNRVDASVVIKGDDLWVRFKFDDGDRPDSIYITFKTGAIAFYPGFTSTSCIANNGRVVWTGKIVPHPRLKRVSEAAMAIAHRSQGAWLPIFQEIGAQVALATSSPVAEPLTVRCRRSRLVLPSVKGRSRQKCKMPQTCLRQVRG